MQTEKPKGLSLSSTDPHHSVSLPAHSCRTSKPVHFLHPRRGTCLGGRGWAETVTRPSLLRLERSTQGFFNSRIHLANRFSYLQSLALELGRTQTKQTDLRGSEGYLPQKHPWEENKTLSSHSFPESHWIMLGKENWNARKASVSEIRYETLTKINLIPGLICAHDFEPTSDNSLKPVIFSIECCPSCSPNMTKRFFFF